MGALAEAGGALSLEAFNPLEGVTMNLTSGVAGWIRKVFEAKASGRSVNVPQRYETLPCGCTRHAPEAIGDERTVWHLHRAEGDPNAIVHHECGKVALRLADSVPLPPEPPGPATSAWAS